MKNPTLSPHVPIISKILDVDNIVASLETVNANAGVLKTAPE